MARESHLLHERFNRQTENIESVLRCYIIDWDFIGTYQSQERGKKLVAVVHADPIFMAAWNHIKSISVHRYLMRHNVSKFNFADSKSWLKFKLIYLTWFREKICRVKKKNILQLFGNNLGVRTINFIIITYGNSWKRQVPYHFRRVDGRCYGILPVIAP